MEDHLRMLMSDRIPSLPFHTYWMQQEWWFNSSSLLRSGISPHFHVTKHLSQIDLRGTSVRITHQSIPQRHLMMIFEICSTCHIKMLVLATATRIRSWMKRSMSKRDNIRSRSLRPIIVCFGLRNRQWNLSKCLSHSQKSLSVVKCRYMCPKQTVNRQWSIYKRSMPSNCTFRPA